MKKAILMIEVPDDFEKGDYINCDYAELPIDKCVYQCTVKGGTCTAEDCPLEIYEIEEEVSCSQCYFYNSDGERCLECDDTYSLFMRNGECK